MDWIENTDLAFKEYPTATLFTATSKMNETPCRRINVSQAAGKTELQLRNVRKREAAKREARSQSRRWDQPDLRCHGCRHWFHWTATPMPPTYSDVKLAEQSIHFVSAEFSQPETHSRANKQLASGQIHDETRTIQSTATHRSNNHKFVSGMGNQPRSRHTHMLQLPLRSSESHTPESQNHQTSSHE